MGFSKDLHKDPARRRGRGKQWLSVWHLEDGTERSQAFTTKAAADRHWKAMETDIARGDYFDPKAGRELLGPVGRRWLASRTVDPSSAIHYEVLWRLHVEPFFGRRQVRAIRPSQIQAWVAERTEAIGTSTAAGAFLVLHGCLSLAVADEMIRRNPCDSPVVAKPRAGIGGKVEPWTSAQVAAVTDAHPGYLRLLPELMTACGLRITEAAAVALEDFDFDDGILHVRRQLKKLGKLHVFALPKNDRERDVPLPDWGGAAVRVHLAAHAPWPCTLAWEKVTGKSQTRNLLFRWSDGSFVRYRSYSEQVWKPALASAGIIGQPVTDGRGRPRYETTRKEGPHQLRHYYASVMLHGGVSVKELAEYLGHHDPAFTLRVYSHLIPASHDRARQVFDAAMFRPRAVADGTYTERRPG